MQVAPKLSASLKQSLQINARITPEVREILDKIETETGLKDQPILKALIHALCTHYKAHGRITLPIQIAEEHPMDGAKSAAKRRAS